VEKKGVVIATEDRKRQRNGVLSVDLTDKSRKRKLPFLSISAIVLSSEGSYRLRLVRALP
jgi:hypothetical protein